MTSRLRHPKASNNSLLNKPQLFKFTTTVYSTNVGITAKSRDSTVSTPKCKTTTPQNASAVSTIPRKGCSRRAPADRATLTEASVTSQSLTSAAAAAADARGCRSTGSCVTKSAARLPGAAQCGATCIGRHGDDGNSRMRPAGTSSMNAKNSNLKSSRSSAMYIRPLTTYGFVSGSSSTRQTSRSCKKAADGFQREPTDGNPRTTTASGNNDEVSASHPQSAEFDTTAAERHHQERNRTGISCGTRTIFGRHLSKHDSRIQSPVAADNESSREAGAVISELKRFDGETTAVDSAVDVLGNCLNATISSPTHEPADAMDNARRADFTGQDCVEASRADQFDIMTTSSLLSMNGMQAPNDIELVDAGIDDEYDNGYLAETWRTSLQAAAADTLLRGKMAGFR